MQLVLDTLLAQTANLWLWEQPTLQVHSFLEHFPLSVRLHARGLMATLVVVHKWPRLFVPELCYLQRSSFFRGCIICQSVSSLLCE